MDGLGANEHEGACTIQRVLYYATHVSHFRVNRESSTTVGLGSGRSSSLSS